MTATDWMEVASGALSNSLAAFAITVTVASGYLVLAYMVGKKLAASQIWIVNILFVLVMATVAFADFASLSTAVKARQEASALLPHWQDLAGSTDMTVLYVSEVTNVLILAGCLKFMWDIRRDK